MECYCRSCESRDGHLGSGVGLGRKGLAVKDIRRGSYLGA